MKKAIYLGIVLIIIGAWIWLSNLGIVIINFSRDWPLLIILLGIYIVYVRIKSPKNKILHILKDLNNGKATVEETILKIKEIKNRGK